MKIGVEDLYEGNGKISRVKKSYAAVWHRLLLYSDE